MFGFGHFKHIKDWLLFHFLSEKENRVELLV
jgi:hypothetical protein